MKILKSGFILSLSLLLAACALTPEQQAQRKAQQLKANQELQVALAKQCDLETGELMYEQFNPPVGRTKADEQAFKARYTEKIRDPMFQACYKLAWQNHKAQIELDEIRRDYYYRDYWYRGWRPCYYCW